jgi:hypothetical protein
VRAIRNVSQVWQGRWRWEDDFKIDINEVHLAIVDV